MLSSSAICSLARSLSLVRSSRSCDPSLARSLQENFGKWNSALQTKDPKKVATLYSTSLSFLPTVSPKHIKSGDLTEDYFKEFVLKNPFGTITDDSVQVYEDGLAYLHTGMYTFELGQGADRKPVAARFSYMWRKEGSDWKITHHHSSVVPGGAPKVCVRKCVRACACACARSFLQGCSVKRTEKRERARVRARERERDPLLGRVSTSERILSIHAHNMSPYPADVYNSQPAGSEDPKKALLDRKKAEMGLGQPRRLFGSATLARMYYGSGEATTAGK